ncbi:helix-turn-helix transcriptional regulator [bacterium]|nr:helix-turn-helix transcriptional regulator [bacterium]
MSQPDVHDVFEKCLGCRYMVALLREIEQGTNRPGRLERSIDGLTGKVLADRLKRLTEYGLVTRTSYNEPRPRVEYELTPFGKRLLEMVGEVEGMLEE